MFSCKIGEIFRNTFFVEHLQMAVSDGGESDESESDDNSYNKDIEAVVLRCSSK